MSSYRRNYVPGGTFFFTVNLKNRRSSLLVQHFEVLRGAIRRVKDKKPFAMKAWVVLPDHLHCVLTLPEQDNDYSGRWRAIKTVFCSGLRDSIHPSRKKSIWQPRFWEHTIQSEEDLHNHINYTHINPIKHGYVTRVIDWPYSSFHHYLRKEIYGENWGGSVVIPESLQFGE